MNRFTKMPDTSCAKSCRDGAKRDPSRGSKGFTLIELIAVIVIIGIMSNFVRIGIQDTSYKAMLYNAAYQLLADVRYAQEAAMNEKRIVRFTVVPASERYYAQYVDTGAYLTNSRGENLDFSFSGDPAYTGINITSSETGSNLTFLHTGRPNNGSIAFFTDATIANINGEIDIIVLGTGLTSFTTASGGGCGC